MQTRTTLNVVGATVTLPSLLLELRRLVAAFGDGQAAVDLAGLIRDPSVNWDAVYLFMITLGASLLVAANWRPAIAAWKLRQIAKERDWDLTSEGAVNYIIEFTHFGASLDSREAARRCVGAFKEAAIAGLIQTAGRRPGANLPERISPYAWSTYHVAYEEMGSKDGPKVAKLQLRRSDQDPTIMYEGIMADWRDIKGVWRLRSVRI